MMYLAIARLTQRLGSAELRWPYPRCVSRTALPRSRETKRAFLNGVEGSNRVPTTRIGCLVCAFHGPVYLPVACTPQEAQGAQRFQPYTGPLMLLTVVR